MTRIAVGGFAHETNSFAPGRTGLAEFAEHSVHGRLLIGDDMDVLLAMNHSIAGFIAACDPETEIHYLACADAEPGGTVEQSTFDTITALLRQRIVEADPIEGLFLDLHGAMVTEADDDGDALILERLRAVLPHGCPVAAAVDLHANVTPRMLRAADVIVAYRTYPHVDMRETGARAAAALSRLSGRRSPALACRYLPFMVPVNKQSTLGGAGRAIYETVEAAEADDPEIISASFVFGFQCADIEAPIPAAFAYAETQAAAERAVDRILGVARAHESAFGFDYVDPAEAARQALAWRGTGPLMLADAQDNPGGGGSGDTMFIARALRDAGIARAVIAMIHDPDAAAIATAAGEGARIRLGLGGRAVPGDAPLEGDYEVIGLAAGEAMMTGPMAGGARIDLGPCARLRLDGIDFLVASKRTQCLDRGFFQHFGLDAAREPVIAIKSAVHYRADFDAIAGACIDVLAPGFDVADFSRLPYRKLRSGIRFHGGDRT